MKLCTRCGTRIKVLFKTHHAGWRQDQWVCLDCLLEVMDNRRAVQSHQLALIEQGLELLAGESEVVEVPVPEPPKRVVRKIRKPVNAGGRESGHGVQGDLAPGVAPVSAPKIGSVVPHETAATKPTRIPASRRDSGDSEADSIGAKAQDSDRRVAAANPARIIPKDRRTIDLLRLEMLLRLV